jgi:hypothetical protein
MIEAFYGWRLCRALAKYASNCHPIRLANAMLEPQHTRDLTNKINVI